MIKITARQEKELDFPDVLYSQTNKQETLCKCIGDCKETLVWLTIHLYIYIQYTNTHTCFEERFTYELHRLGFFIYTVSLIFFLILLNILVKVSTQEVDDPRSFIFSFLHIFFRCVNNFWI